MDWDALTVGERFGPYRYEVTADIVGSYRQLLDDHEVIEVDGQPVAPPAILTFPVLQLIDDKYRARPGSIHAQQQFELLAPVRIGAVLTVTGVLTAMQLKRGRRYYTVESSAVDDRGIEVMRAQTVGLYPDSDVALAGADHG
jgi:hypothetical protein